MHDFLQDFRYGARLLSKNPGFSALAIVILALGIGANTAIFSVVNAVLLRSLPFAEPHQIMMIWETRAQERVNGSPYNVVAAPDFLDWRAQSRSFTSMAGFDDTSYNFASPGEAPERLDGLRVSTGFLSVLGVSPVLGRAFRPEEEQPDRSRVVILTYGLWQRRFASNPAIVGQMVRLNNEPYTVIGVLPAQFRFPLSAKAQLLSPLVLADADAQNRGAHWLRIISRRKAATTQEQAQAELTALSAHLAQQYPNFNRGHSALLVPFREELTGKARLALLVLLGTVALVLVIACANVANLLLARAEARRKEVALRQALGSTRTRLIRQFLTESAVLALAAGGVGFLFANWGLALLQQAFSENLDFFSLLGSDQVAMDWRVLVVTLGVSIATGLVFGLAPAVTVSRSDLNLTLKQTGSRGSTGEGSRLRQAFVVAEIALALMLAISAGLLLKSFAQLVHVDPGFRSEHALTVRLSLPPNKYHEPRQIVSFFQEFLSRVQALPGIQAAGATDLLPFGGSDSRTRIEVEGRVAAPDETLRTYPRVVTPGYFAALGIPLLRGRGLTEGDQEGRTLVAVINQNAARQYFGQADPLGRRFRLGDKDWFEIVGVVGNVRHRALDRDSMPEVYLSFVQRPAPEMTAVLRTAADPASLVAGLRQVVNQLDPDQPIAQMQSMDQLIAGSVAPQRFNTVLLSLFAGLAVLLAVVGIFGVMSYTVSQRTSEIGIRMALGAKRGDVLRLVLGNSLGLTALGVVLGVGGALAATRILTRLLFGVTPTDPLVFTSMAALFVGVALLASYLPARRAAKVDPLVALRYE